MSERKRKRYAHSLPTSSQKKVAFKQPNDSIKVSCVQDENLWQPVLASSPGLSLPKDISFKPYRNGRELDSELLLHSEEHPTLDYTAREDSSVTSDTLSHYIGVYDPQRQRLKLVRAKRMTIRSTLKSARPRATTPSDDEAMLAPEMSSRSALALAFGTKKSQKAVKEVLSNAVASSQKGSSQLDAVAEAVLSSMPTETATKETIQAELDALRPIPAPNLEALTPADVYPIPMLVGGENTLAKVRVKQWMDAKEANEPIQTRSHFISTRITAILETGDFQQIRALRYLELLIAWYKAIFINADHTRRRPTWEHSHGASKDVWVPKRDSAAISDILESITSIDMLDSLTARFTLNGKGSMKRWNEEKLITHIFALALHLDGFEVDIYHLRWDLMMTVPESTKLWQEMGCQVNIPMKKEYEKMGLARLEAKERKIARLKVPVKLPKPRGAGKRRR